MAPSKIVNGMLLVGSTLTIREQILKMEAGREMNRLIANKVMGFVPCNVWLYGNLGAAGGAISMNNGCEHSGKCYPADEKLPFGGPRHYSTDIAAAWEVVEKLDYFSLEKITANNDDKSYIVRFVTQINNEMQVTNTIAPTAPLAICRAALLAVMEMDNG